MLPARAVGRYCCWATHVRCSFIWRHISSGERARDESKDYTETRLSPHCANYLSVLSTFIKLQHNPCPEYRLLRLKTIFSTFQLSAVPAWWSCLGSGPQYHSLTNRWKQSLKFAQTYWHILLFSNSTERERVRHNNNFRLAGPRLAPSLRAVDKTTLMIPRSFMERLTSPDASVFTFKSLLNLR